MKKIFLKILKLLKKYETIKPYELQFQEGLNVIVGENGSGKSTMFKFIMQYKEFKDVLEIDFEPFQYNFFDSEKQNPRTKTFFENSYDIQSKFISHGEAVFPILKHLSTIENKVILLDEPENGISLQNQKKLLGCFNKAIEKKCQIIISTHSYFLTKNVEKGFDMTKKIG